MISWSNKKMRQLNIDVSRVNAGLPVKLLAVLKAGVVEEKGYYFLQSFRPQHTPASPESPQGHNDVECLHNHIHMEDYLASGSTEEQATIAASYVMAGRELFKKAFPALKFRGIITADEQENGGVTARFYCVREGELPWLCDDAEEFTSEGVLVFEL